MILYLIKVSLCLLVFQLLYGGLLRNTTFFRLNRYYLLLGMVASFIIPGITISGFNQPHDFSLTESLETVWIEATDPISIGKPVVVTQSEINYALLFSIIYFVGVLILLSRLILWLIRYGRLVKSGEVGYVEGIPIIKTRQSQAFAFFNVIILPEHEANPLVIMHEKVHVQQRHWIDLLLIELTCVVIWFNPFVRLYRKAIKLQHEYLADSHTIDSGVAIENYLHCILNQIQHENSFVLINKFNSLPIKSRIMMMTKNKTHVTFKSAYLLVIPILCLLLMAFSNKTIVFEPEPVTGENKPAMAPVQMEKATVSATYGERMHPATGKKQFHTGIDFLLAEGEIVMTTATGTVVVSRYDSLRGNYIIVKHDEVYSTSYSHLKSALVKIGDPVELGQKIGYVGSTGKLSAGPHLHYEVIKDGKPVDPKDYLPEK
jgi:beta-lactamase regulating signal transducer with metallopeptidase domain